MASVAEIVTTMVGAAKESLGKDWGKARPFAKAEFDKLARSMVSIGKLVEEGEVNAQQAQALLNIHLNTTKMVLLTVEGLGIIAVENAVNAALKQAKDAVNSTVGFGLL